MEDAAAAGNALETRGSHGYAVESNETFPKRKKDQRGGHEVKLHVVIKAMHYKPLAQCELPLS